MTLTSMSCARCGVPYDPTHNWALSPGVDAIYGHARDLLGEEDKRLPPIILAHPVAPSLRHFPACAK